MLAHLLEAGENQDNPSFGISAAHTCRSWSSQIWDRLALASFVDQLAVLLFSLSINHHDHLFQDLTGLFWTIVFHHLIFRIYPSVSQSRWSCHSKASFCIFVQEKVAGSHLLHLLSLFVGQLWLPRIQLRLLHRMLLLILACHYNHSPAFSRTWDVCKRYLLTELLVIGSLTVVEKSQHLLRVPLLWEESIASSQFYADCLVPGRLEHPLLYLSRSLANSPPPISARRHARTVVERGGARSSLVGNELRTSSTVFTVSPRGSAFCWYHCLGFCRAGKWLLLLLSCCVCFVLCRVVLRCFVLFRFILLCLGLFCVDLFSLV